MWGWLIRGVCMLHVTKGYFSRGYLDVVEILNRELHYLIL